MWNARLNEAQAGIKIAGRNNNNLRYADDITLRKQKQTKEPLDEDKRGEWKSWFKTQHPKKPRSWNLVPSLHDKQMRKKMETVTDIILRGSKITVDGDCSHEIKSHLLLGRKARKWQPTPVFVSGKFHGQRSLAGYSQWGCKSRTWLSD